MTLLTAGYWQTTFWAENYWNPDYWLHYGAVAPTEGAKWLTRMAPRPTFPPNLLILIRDWLEAELYGSEHS